MTPANEDRPSWRRKIFAATQAAIAAFTAEEREQADRDRREMREISRAKKSARRLQAARINEMIVGGSTVAEIAAWLGISENALWSRKAAWGFPLAKRQGFRRLFVWVSDNDIRALDSLAKERRIERAKLMERLIAAAVAGDSGNAVWLLDGVSGKAA